jgi:parvulin-like peptidyl-prolyl isomerase
MRFRFCIVALVVMGISAASAQVASHAPTPVKAEVNAKAAAGQQIPESLAKPVARVNGAVLTELDLLRMMNSMFPYGRQHNGFPKSMEADIRKGALEMIIFEELLYQEAKRRNLAVPAGRMARAEGEFRKQFATQADYQQALKMETNGSRPALREKIRRSLLIEAMLNTEVRARSRVTLAQAKAHYLKNAKQFEHSEIFHIQSISIMPPNETPAVLKEARQRAEEAVKAAKAAKTYRDFGLLAEKLSDDDFRVNMGDHKPIGGDKLPPPVVKAALAMKPGEVSDLIQLGNAYTIFRLIEHKPAGKTPFDEVKGKLISDMQKQKTEQVRAALGEKLRKTAQIERL